MNRNTGWLLNTLVATSAPVVVILIRMIGAGPGAASANEPTNPETASVEDLLGQVRPTEGLVDAWSQSEAVWAKSDPAPPQPGETPGPTPIETGPRDEIVPPRLTLSAVLGGSPRGAAVLDERIYWVGEDLGQGWTLDRVDHQSRTVTLRHESGQEHRIEFIEGG